MSLRDECTQCGHAKTSHHEIVTSRPSGPFGLPRPAFVRVNCIAIHCECLLYEWSPPDDDD